MRQNNGDSVFLLDVLQLIVWESEIHQMVAGLERGFPMVTWFRLNAKPDTRWLGIVFYDAFMANGILLSRCAMVRTTEQWVYSERLFRI